MTVYQSNLRRIRIERGYTQTDLAREIGVTRQTINRLERDDNNTTLDLAYKLARTLQMPIEEIFSPMDAETVQ